MALERLEVISQLAEQLAADYADRGVAAPLLVAHVMEQAHEIEERFGRECVDHDDATFRAFARLAVRTLITLHLADAYALAHPPELADVDHSRPVVKVVVVLDDDEPV